MERKTAEPTARQASIWRKNPRYFAGAGLRDDEAAAGELRTHVREELADPRAVLAIDPSAFPEPGDDSCGAARQWGSRLGKADSCQVGVFLAYAAPGGHAPLDRRLYLPEDWAADPERRKECHVPEDIVSQEKWQIGSDLSGRSRAELPHAWVAADGEFGRVAEFRDAHRQRGERYVLDVPCGATVRDLDGRRPPRKEAGVDRRRAIPFRRADARAARQPAERWTRLVIRAGAKGPLEVGALVARVRAERGRRIGPEERSPVARALGPGAETD